MMKPSAEMMTQAHAARHFICWPWPPCLPLPRGVPVAAGAGWDAKKAAEEFLHFRIIHAALPLGILAHALGSTNIHHRRTGALDDIGEVRQGCDRGRSHGRRRHHGRCCSRTEAASKAPARVFFMGVIATVFYLDFSSMELAT
jgi:hypothetical protein